MYELLHDVAMRPKPFSVYTAEILWTKPHLAQQMLHFHLNQETDLASRRIAEIDQIVARIDDQLELRNKSLCDLGCGPGLYTQRFSEKGAKVTGVDFSEHSLAYARSQGGQDIHYLRANYLSDTLPVGFDIITLIYTDFCALSAEQRKKLLLRVREMLNPNGCFVFDVVSESSFISKTEFTTIENRLMSGFWSANDYVGIQRSFIYPNERISLDRYLIVEPHETWQVFNWAQHFTQESIEEELNLAGFDVEKMVGGLSGESLKSGSDLIGVIASLA